MTELALAIQLLEIVLAAAVKNNAPQEVLQVFQEAITKLSGVTGTDVTYQQLESLRTKTTW